MNSVAAKVSGTVHMTLFTPHFSIEIRNVQERTFGKEYLPRRKDAQQLAIREIPVAERRQARNVYGSMPSIQTHSPFPSPFLNSALFSSSPTVLFFHSHSDGNPFHHHRSSGTFILNFDFRSPGWQVVGAVTVQFH
jgi:hypothetical protein